MITQMTMDQTAARPLKLLHSKLSVIGELFFKAVSFLATNGWIKVFSKGRGARNFYAINVEKIEAVYQQSKGAAEQIKLK